MTPALPATALDGEDAGARTGSAWVALSILVGATIAAAVDRQLLVLMAEPLKQSLGLSDTQLGLLQGAGVTLFAGLAAFPIGWLADRYDRRLVLAVCVLLWSASTAACGLARGFDQLMLAATFLGLGEAGLVPIVYGLIPDLFAKRQRVQANAVYGVAAVFGAGIGIALSGELLAWADGLRAHVPVALRGLEAWRLAFVFAAALGPLVALAVLMLRLPRRALADSDDGEHGFLPYLRRHARSLASLFIGIGASSMGMTALGTWLPVVAAREFGASVSDTGRAMGLAFALGTVLGGLLGGLQARLIRHWGVGALVRVLWVCLGLAGLATAAMPAMPGLTGLFSLFGVQVAAVFVALVAYASLVQQIAPAALRSRTLAVNAAVTALLSAASPIAVGLLSDRLGGALLTAVVAVTASAMVMGALLLWRSESAVLRSAVEVNG